MALLTRREVKQLEYNHPLPNELDGKHKVFEEVFVNNGGEKSPATAAYHLVQIREGHPESSGWHTEEGHEGIFKDTDGLYYAYRHHAQYK